MHKSLIKYLSIATIAAAIAGCNSGSTASNSTSPVYATATIPTYGYSGKYAVHLSVAGGPQVLAEIDTGSDFLLVESSLVGSNIIMTDESITFVYDHGTNPRTGLLGYTYVSFLDNSGESVLTTNSLVPVVVVESAAIIGNQGNQAILGLRMNSQVSVKNFLPYPYNQMFVMNIPESQLIFGNLNQEQLESFGMVQLASQVCNNGKVSTSATNPCWNDMAVPVNYIISGDPNQIELFNSLFDSGASSSIQFNPLPSDLNLDGNRVTNSVTAVMYTSLGNKPIQMTPRIDAFATESNGGIVNVGNNIFNYYQILFNQSNGMIGLK